jgi:hypothetical protein
MTWYVIFLLLLPTIKLLGGELFPPRPPQINSTTPRSAFDQSIIDRFNKTFSPPAPSIFAPASKRISTVTKKKTPYQTNTTPKKPFTIIDADKRRLHKACKYLEDSFALYARDQSSSRALNLLQRINTVDSKLKRIENEQNLRVIPGELLRATRNVKEFDEPVIKALVSVFRKLLSHDINLFGIAEDKQSLLKYALGLNNCNGAKALLLVNEELENIYKKESRCARIIKPTLQVMSIDSEKNDLNPNEIVLLENAQSNSITTHPCLNRMINKRIAYVDSSD